MDFLVKKLLKVTQKTTEPSELKILVHKQKNMLEQQMKMLVYASVGMTNFEN